MTHMAVITVGHVGTWEVFAGLTTKPNAGTMSLVGDVVRETIKCMYTNPGAQGVFLILEISDSSATYNGVAVIVDVYFSTA